MPPPHSGGMKLDTHVHTHYSGMTHIWPLSYIVRESYNTPERVYRLAKARGMDLVAITDHDTVEGAMRLAHFPDVIVGCEVSAHFPGHNVDVHLGVLDITREQFDEIDRRRHDVVELLPYLREQDIFTTINHVASQVNGRLTAALIASLLPWVDAFEVRNGSRLRAQNRTAEALAAATGKFQLGGSDSHTGRGIGRTCTVIDDVHTRAEFLAALRVGRGRVEGRHGWYMTMTSDLIRFAGRFYEERGVGIAKHPLDWRRHAALMASAVMLPAVPLIFVGAAVHFIREARFNRSLLFDLVARPAAVHASAASLVEAA
jgi:predicted metal-dependent phosphoesterase TrpH